MLNERAAGTPLAYGAAAGSGTSCTTLGYGRNGTKYQQGTLGQRRQGSGTINGTVPNSSALFVLGSTLANSGDFGGPLLCNNDVAGVFSAYRYDGQMTIDGAAYQPISGALKTWIDGIVAANPPPSPVTDAGADASSGGASGSSGGPGSSSSSSSGGSGTSGTPSTPTPEDGTSDPGSAAASEESSGCSVSSSTAGAGPWVFALAATIAASLRRRRRASGRRAAADGG